MTGKLAVITGSMFSGKSRELVREVKRAEIAGSQVQVFKPSIDTRYHDNQVVSHDGNECAAIPIENPKQLLECIEDETEVVAIDEAQFFDDRIIAVVKSLLERNFCVIVAGLPLDFRGEPFGPMPALIALADQITHLTAVCTFEKNGKRCGADATKTQRIIDGQPANYNDPIILVGAQEAYEARCPNHHIVPGKPTLE